MTGPVTLASYRDRMNVTPDRIEATASCWLGETTTTIDGTVEDIRERLPSFDRLPFGVNRRRDMIVRLATHAGDVPVPISTVSKQYVLVQHGAVLDALATAMKPLDVETEGLACRVVLTESGSRAAVRVTLPDAFALTPRDGHRMALTFECFNSVDGTVSLFALLGWFRFVCANGLVVGTTHARIRQQHRPALLRNNFADILERGLLDAAAEREILTDMTARPVPVASLSAWVDGPVAKAWGPHAAARVFGIATEGMDGQPSRKPKDAPPSRRWLEQPKPVPGAGAPRDTVYGAVQALAWVAARRRNVVEQVTWRSQIRELVGLL